MSIDIQHMVILSINRVTLCIVMLGIHKWWSLGYKYGVVRYTYVYIDSEAMGSARNT